MSPIEKAGGALLLFFSLCAAAGDNTLRAGNGNEPETLDPHKSEGVSAANILRDLYEGLCGVSPRGEVLPGAARGWEIAHGGRLYTFHLRPEAKWSNGDPLTANDFVAGLRRSADPATGSAFSQILSPLENADAILAGKLPPTALGVVAVDAHTLQIRLKAATPYLLGLLTHASTYPIHVASLAQHGSAFARPGKLVSNGAYQLSEWVVQSQVTLTRNPHYWNNAHTKIDRVIYLPSEDINSELKRYRANELDTTYEIPLVQAPWIRKNLKDELRIATYIGSYYYGFNLSRPPFQGNRKLRQALNMVVDREVIVNKVMNGVAKPAYGWVPPGTWNYTPQKPAWAKWPMAQRITLAQKLYAEAGYSQENPLDVEIRYNTHDDHKRIAIIISAMWKQALGVRTRLLNEEFKIFINNRKLKKITEVFRASWIGDYDDASAYADTLLTGHGQNDEAYNNPAYDALVTQAAFEPDEQKRRTLLERAEQWVIEDVPLLPVYFYVSKHLVKPYVKGWEDNLLDYHYTKDLELVPAR